MAKAVAFLGLTHLSLCNKPGPATQHRHGDREASKKVVGNAVIPQRCWGISSKQGKEPKTQSSGGEPVVVCLSDDEGGRVCRQQRAAD